MLEVCLAMVLALHLLCVNVASAGPIVCMWLDWRAARGDAAAEHGARWLALTSLLLLLLGGGLGVVVAGLLWNDGYHDLLHRFTYKLTWAAWELLFSLVLMTGYVVVVRRGPARSRAGRLLRGTTALLTSTNLLYHFPILFVVVSEMGAGYLDPPEHVTAEVFRELMREPSVLARSVHFWLASFAVTGVALLARGSRLVDEPAEIGRRLVVWGARIALVPTVLQMLVGVWVVSVVPVAMQQRLLGGDLLAMAGLGLSIIAALWLMQSLATLALGDAQAGAVRLAVWLTIAIVVMMTFTSRRGLNRPSAAASPSPEISCVC